MDQRLSFVTLATPDLDAARAFYRDAFGWEPHLDVPGEIVFYQVAPGLLVGFFDAASFDRDLGLPAGSTSGVSGMTLAHNVGDRAGVYTLASAAVAAGAAVVKPPQESEFGGIFHALVRDPNGVVWEIAHNPGHRVEADGTVVLG
ncbi:VOC family protein [Pseudonocardia dioxanivorans]|jgi:catechol 2,3-dioxygenase-like lactoylglutathione lyase family enzyme|uniref:Glyoxalase/bleomycin resistance protein/dioxygenase n=1 Tax=Pseudonocardia dioxanivorans (strain ATCC 55486 / DSM 44775 / JCM 13855 / CB1190) TaxID=675635 RepID=F4D1R6_PSEUX|nr:VOC family protein [Pseudonocardia dioxanivorans]AEA27976.1 Glyoxalase/bleomycin resistance protein/dioxygenase [Pseudonocardia dioxanivorans CB1190]